MFNIRVYGILIKKDEILLSHEEIDGFKMVKLPGGGLNHGEGTLDTIRRELKEEMGLDFTAFDHFYTTDFYQQSAFHIDHQLISIYYKSTEVDKIKSIDLETINNRESHQREQFKWHKIKTLNESLITFPIDKFVINLLKTSIE